MSKTVRLICWNRTAEGSVSGNRIGDHILQVLVRDFKAFGFTLSEIGNNWKSLNRETSSDFGLKGVLWLMLKRDCNAAGVETERPVRRSSQTTKREVTVAPVGCQQWRWEEQLDPGCILKECLGVSWVFSSQMTDDSSTGEWSCQVYPGGGALTHIKCSP